MYNIYYVAEDKLLDITHFRTNTILSTYYKQNKLSFLKLIIKSN